MVQTAAKRQAGGNSIDRLEMVETRLAATATREDLSRVEDRFDELSRTMAATREDMARLEGRFDETKTLLRWQIGLTMLVLATLLTMAVAG